MDSETLDFIEKVFANNNITIPYYPPSQLYQKVIYKYRNLINNKKYLPLQDILELENINWDVVASHPEITIEIIRKHCKNLKFKLLAENTHISKELLCQLLIELETSGQLYGNLLISRWNSICKYGNIDIDIYLKYSDRFTMDLELLENLNLKNSNIDEIKKINIIEKFVCNSNKIYDINTLKVILDYDFSHHNLIFVLKRLFGKVHDNTNHISSSISMKKNNTYYQNLVDKYFEIYENDNAFISELCEFSEIISKSGFDHSFFNVCIVNKLVQKSNVYIHDLKYLVNMKVIKSLPTITVKYKDHANYLFTEYHNGLLTGYCPPEKGQYTLRQFLKLQYKDNTFIGIFHHDNVRYYRNIFWYNNTKDKFVDCTKNYDLHTLNDIYNNLIKYCDKSPRFDDIKITRLYLYPTIISNFKMIKSRDDFKSILMNCILTTMELEFILEKVNLSPDETAYLCLIQPLTPDLINKYGSKLDWNVLKYNKVWLIYPPRDFNKLPIFDEDNFWLWASPKEKIQKLKDMKIKLPFTLVDEEYIEFEYDSKFLMKSQGENILHFHPPKKCISGCNICNINSMSIKSKLHTYNYRIRDQKISIIRIANIRFFLPTSNIILLHGYLNITDLSMNSS